MAGGLDWLVQQAERLMRRHPQQITILAPLSTFLLTVCVGTGHAVYSLLPLIADVALKTRIRPERPMAISSVASQMGITASPVAAAVTTFLAMTAKTDAPVTLAQILMVTLPAGLIGVLAAAFWSMRRGLDLDKDPEFLARMKGPDFRATVEMSVTTLDKTLPKAARLSVVLFFSGILTIVALALYPSVLPLAKGKPIPMTTVVQLVMLAFGAFILFAADVKAAAIAKSEVFTAGMIAVVSIFGIAWMSDTFVKANETFLVDNIKAMVEYAPWTFALAMFAVSAFVKSQAAASVRLPDNGKVFISVKDSDKSKVVEIARDLHASGFTILATRGTAATVAAAGIPVTQVNKVTEGRPHIVDMIKNNEISLIVNTVDEKRKAINDSRSIRTSALAARVTMYTTVWGAEAAAVGMKNRGELVVYPIQTLHAEIN